MSGLEDSHHNYLLTFVCAIYGVTRTTKWLLNNIEILHNTKNIEIDVRNSTIKYLANKLFEHDIRIDTYVDIFIEDQFREDHDYFLEKPVNDDEIKNFSWIVNHEIPLRIANMVDMLEYVQSIPDVKLKRNRELQRNYLFWRWRNKGLKLKDIAKKWDDLNNGTVEVTDADIVAKGIKQYQGSYGRLKDNPLYLYSIFLTYHGTSIAAEKTLDFIFRKVNFDDMVS